MLQVIHCNWCGKEGWHQVEFTFQHMAESCKECHHIRTQEWKFWFCDQECFFNWAKHQEIAEKGIPCQDCHETGWAFGFEQNGKCDTCNGEKRVKKRKEN